MKEIYDISVAGDGEAWDFDMNCREHRKEVSLACERLLYQKGRRTPPRVGPQSQQEMYEQHEQYISQGILQDSMAPPTHEEFAKFC